MPSSGNAPDGTTAARAGRDGAPQRRATLATIAAEAGVSMPTVSKVVNGRPDVAAATRVRVERILDRHQYHAAGSQRGRRAGPRRPRVQRPGQPVGGRDPARRRGVVRRARDGRGRLRRPARQRPARQLDQRAGQPRHRRRDPGDVGADRCPAGAAAQQRHPAGRRRPGEPARRRTCRASARRTGRAGWPPPSTC